ncbi:hypothetical protein AB1Y20_000694 [Prymnesium parvum]|uniref:TFIID subunit TAF5 NTD2 domain-containing protein n=1 Tax=Prymnesium parvum TaxID=97485 RepID=A0AB34K5I6_PRYPA
MAEEAVQSQAVHAAALKYLQQRGYRSGQQLLAGDASAKPAEMKLNELVICDAQRRVLSCALHLPLEDSTSHEESYVELCGWIRARPLDQRRELSPICYPLYVHCFIALVEKQQDGAAFLTAHARLHQAAEQREEVEKLAKARPHLSLRVRSPPRLSHAGPPSLSLVGHLSSRARALQRVSQVSQPPANLATPPYTMARPPTFTPPPLSTPQTPRQAAVSICVLGLHSDASRASITSFELSPCGRLCACGHADGAILLGRFSRSDLLLSRFAAPECSRPPVRKSRLIGHRGPVYSCAFSRESHYLLSGSQDGTVKLWSCRHNTCLVTYRDHGFPVWHVAFSPHNAQFLSCCHDGAVRIFCTERLSPLRVFPGHLSDVTAAHFHPNGGYVLSCSRDATLRFWAVADACCLRLLLGHTAAVLAVAVAPDGAHAASGSEDKTVRLWQLATGSCLRVLQTHAGPVGHVVFNANGKLLASGGGKQVVVWDAKRALSPADNASALVAVTSPLAVESAVFMLNQPVLLVCSQDLTMPL